MNLGKPWLEPWGMEYPRNTKSPLNTEASTTVFYTDEHLFKSCNYPFRMIDV